MVVSFSLATAPRSPACRSLTAVAVLPCITCTCCRRSCELRLKLVSVASFFSTPDITLK